MDAHDVLVRHLTREQQLALEAALDLLCGARVGEDLGSNHLDGHRHAQLGVPGLIDGAHAADAETTDDVVSRTEGLSGLEGAGIEGRRRVSASGSGRLRGSGWFGGSDDRLCIGRREPRRCSGTGDRVATCRRRTSHHG